MNIAAFHERRDDRMEWPFVGSEDVRAAGPQRESGGAILQDEAVAAHCNSRSKCAGQALNQGNDVSIAIDGGEIAGVPTGVKGANGSVGVRAGRRARLK